MRRTDKRGFSLVELVVVIAILGVLAAILTPQFVKYIEKSRAGVCAANLSALARDMLAESIYQQSDDMDALLQATLSSQAGQTVCPSGGTITVTGSSANFVLNCSVHGTRWGQSLSRALAAVAALDTSSMSGAELNAAIAAALGEKPAVESDVIAEVFAGAALQNIGAGLSWYAHDTIIGGSRVPVFFAGRSNSANGGWNAFLVYVNGQMYKSTATTAWNDSIIDPILISGLRADNMSEYLSALTAAGFVKVE